jgi:pyruvate,water dikinase
MRMPRRLRQARLATDQWWRSELPRIAVAGPEEAHRRYLAALGPFGTNCILHGVTSLAIVQPVLDQLTRLVAALGDAGTGLMAGYGGHDETQMVLDLWECSRGRLDIDSLLTRHGYHGPREGEISGVVWREDAGPLLKILKGYGAVEEGANPTAAEAVRAAERERSERDLLAALPVSRRAWARTVLALARRYVPLRGVGKAAFLQSLDVARAAARRLGTCLAAEGVFDDPTDIFFLTNEELCEANWVAARERVEFRRARRQSYEEVDLPNAWRGMPDPEPVAGFEGGVGILQGVAASPGVTEGRVKVITDPAEMSIEAGEILVAHVTDPSWASVLFLASALVTDLGGLLSHAAVVARELGVPCVANTKVGTKVLRTGDRCRVDGTTGRVEVLARAEGA